MAASFKATFFAPVVQTEGVVVITSEVSFNQPMDVRGRPKAGVRSDIIHLTLVGNDRGALTYWAMDPMKAISGSIVFEKLTGGTLRTLDFVDGYCIHYKEVMITGDSVAAYQFNIGISARQIKMDNSNHDNMWSDWMPGGK